MSNASTPSRQQINEFINNLIAPISRSWGELAMVCGAQLLAVDINTNRIKFSVPRGYCANKARTIELGINGKDLYYVYFYNVRGRLVDKLEDIYFDCLEEHFREHTGMATRMPRFV